MLAATHDFIARSKLIALAPGETEDRVKVPIIDDTIEEDTETFTAKLSVLEITMHVSAAVATVTIIDNDGEYNSRLCFVVTIIIGEGSTVNPVMLAPKIISVFDTTHILAAYKCSEILTASYNT